MVPLLRQGGYHVHNKSRQRDNFARRQAFAFKQRLTAEREPLYSAAIDTVSKWKRDRSQPSRAWRNW
jgi:hypothetical protein